MASPTIQSYQIVHAITAYTSNFVNILLLTRNPGSHLIVANSNNAGPALPEELRGNKWYAPEVPELSPETRDVLENYSEIPPSQINKHLSTIRDKAWAIHHYPCIGQWRFLELFIGSHNLYPEILHRLLTGTETFLDLGCAFAQDIRRLVADGVPSTQTFASDLRLDFIELGQELFRDKDTLKTRFIAADIFDEKSELDELDGKCDVIGASSFFHLFDWEQQVRVGKRVVRLLVPREGSLVVGRQVGNENAGEYHRLAGTGGRYRHNEQSWRRMWDEIGAELDVKFEVLAKAWPIGEEMLPYADPGTFIMEFSVRRL